MISVPVPKNTENSFWIYPKKSQKKNSEKKLLDDFKSVGLQNGLIEYLRENFSFAKFKEY